MPTALITGANRGLGFGLVEAYAADGWRVIACARTPGSATALQKVAQGAKGRVTIHPLDVEDHAAIERLAAELKGQPIDLLLNVAGWVGAASAMDSNARAGIGHSKFADWERMYRINVIGPMKMVEAFVDNIAASQQKKIVSLTSVMGSIGSITAGGFYPYRASKAALNALMRSLAADLKSRDIIVVPIHPGWVRTDMGGPNAQLETSESVRGMKKVIDGLRPTDSGTFKVYDGSTLPW